MPVLSDELMHWGPTAETMSLEGLRQQLLADTGITLASADSSGGFTDAVVLPLVTTGERLWAVYTTGMRSYPPEKDQPHVVALYTRSGDVWQQLAMQPIGSADNPDDLGAGYIDRGGVHQVTVKPQGVWCDSMLSSVPIAARCTYFATPGGQITVEAANTSASPGSGYVADLNGDGLGDVVLDASDAYVFCYACGVRYVDYSVLRWDGDALVPVELSLLPESARPRTRHQQQGRYPSPLNLWQDTLNQLAMVAAQNQADDTGIVGSNVALIHLR